MFESIRPRRALSGVMAAALVIGTMAGLGSLQLAEAEAVTPPVVQRPAQTFTADALPTVQMNGVAWTQTTSGNAVYVGGQFTSARPAGSAIGQNERPAQNFLSFDIRTGVMDTSFAPTFNSTVKDIKVTPDGTRVYVAGSFVTASGENRYRIAGYDKSTGQLISAFTPSTNATIAAIAVTNDVVYVGGWFSQANGVPRSKLAAFSAANGALLGWAPAADADVQSMTMTPDASKVIVGGKFKNVNGSAAYGVASIDAASGALMPFALNTVVRNAGDSAGSYYLTADADTIYGTNFNFGTGNFEGLWAAAPDDGAVRWLNDCHGDTYSAFSANGVVYGAGHPHHCQNIGGFPDTNPRVHHYLMGYTKAAAGTVTTNQQGGAGYGDFAGQPAPSITSFFPDFTPANFTGQYQATWSLSGNNSYMVAGGEFTRVGGVGQQGLVRFALPAISPHKVGPTLKGSQFVSKLAAIGSSAVRVNWTANWDRDDQDLSYQVVRSDKTATPLATKTLTSQFWNRPAMSYLDDTVEPGKTYRYRVVAIDGDGNRAVGDYVDITVPVGQTLSTYAKAVVSDGATKYWRLDSLGATSPDLLGADPLTTMNASSVAEGAVQADPNKAASFTGSTSSYAVTSVATPGPNTFSAEAWFKTTSTSGGKILGFGSASSGTSGSYDRHVYMSDSGQLTFGVYPNAVRAVSSVDSYNDGKWHQVVATMSPAGMVLYVDGLAVGRDASTTNGQSYNGYWRIGGDNVGGWPNSGSSNFFAGAIDEVAIYDAPLDADQVRNHFRAAGGVETNQIPEASFTWLSDSLTVAFDASGSTDPDGTIASYSWDFGDGKSGNGASPSHTYATSGSYNVTLTVTDDRGALHQVTHTVLVTKVNQSPLPTFTSSGTNLDVAFDASGASDPDGSLEGYSWSFGDGKTGSGVSPNHVYAAAGTYTVTLTVTDSDGATAAVSQDLTVVAKNVSPVAEFTSTATDLKVVFDAAASADSDGSIASYAWSFGDGGTATGVKPSHTYTAGGSYDVILTVTDNRGATNVVTKPVTVVAPNTPPTAAFVSTVDKFKLAVDASTSSDPNGAVMSYAWKFGDGASATGKTANHTYASNGTYTVTLMVTDSDGATDAMSQTVSVVADNQSPTASFTSTVSKLQANFDAAASVDADGTVAQYGWTFGDGTSGSGVTTSHTYASSGTYSVTLTVTDDAGATNVLVKNVSVVSGPATTVKDTFSRTTSAGWGSADTGGAWTLTNSAAFSSGSGVGSLRFGSAGSLATASLNSSSPSTDFTVTSEVRVDKVATGSGVFVSFQGRKVGTSDYRLKLRLMPNGETHLVLASSVNGVETVFREVNVPAATYAAGDVLKVQFQVSGVGTTTLAGKVWKSTASEPAAAQVARADTTAALQSAGTFGITGYLGGNATNAPIVVKFDNLSVTAGS